MTNFDIIGNKKIFLGVSAILLVISAYGIAMYGFRQGIDFVGGTLWRVQILDENPNVSDLEKTLVEDLKIEDSRVNYDSTSKSFLVRIPASAETNHDELVDSLTNIYPSLKEMSYQSIGPSVGKELRSKSITSLIFVLIAISLYIAFAFRKVFRPVSSWKYGLITLVTLFHDVILPAGMLAFLGHYGQVEIDSNFVVALLVILGFSVHDTIVVFDRIRENLLLDRNKTKFATVINDSINQTLARSINTSLTLILVLLALYLVGPAALEYFVLTLLVGVTAGIYSSIFVASPLLLVWHDFSASRSK